MNQQNDFENEPLQKNKPDVNNDETLLKNEKPVSKKSKLKKVLLCILIVIIVFILSGILTVFILIQKGKSSLLNVESMNINL